MTDTAYHVVTVSGHPRSWLLRIVAAVCRNMLAIMWRRRLAKFGRGSEIATPAYIAGGRSIAIGESVRIWRSARIEAVGACGAHPKVFIGDRTVIQPHVHIGAAESVRIGEGALFASYVYITDHDHDYLDPSDPVVSNGRVLTSPVSIGDYVRLGEQVMVLKGVTIGERSIIGASSVVTRDVPPYSIAVGSPARVVKRYDRDRGEWIKVDSK